jgi:alpha-galactosidase
MTGGQLLVCPMHSWRISHDMNPEFVQVMAQIQSVLPFQALFEPMARPGCWPDPDMLQLHGMNPTEGRSHFSVWAIASAPLVLSFDLNNTALLDKLWPIIAQPAS